MVKQPCVTSTAPPSCGGFSLQQTGIHRSISTKNNGDKKTKRRWDGSQLIWGFLSHSWIMGIYIGIRTSQLKSNFYHPSSIVFIHNLRSDSTCKHLLVWRCRNGSRFKSQKNKQTQFGPVLVCRPVSMAQFKPTTIDQWNQFGHILASEWHFEKSMMMPQRLCHDKD